MARSHASLRNLAPLLAAAIFILLTYTLLTYTLLTRWAIYSNKPAFTIAHFLTLKLRKPVKPHFVLSLQCCVVVGSAGPDLARGLPIATRGWVGSAALKTLRRDCRYWLQGTLPLLAALWLPPRLMAWTPFMNGFGLELFSLIVRVSVAYLVFVGGLLGLELVTTERANAANAFATRDSIILL